MCTKPAKSTLPGLGLAGSSQIFTIFWSPGVGTPCPITGSIPCNPGGWAGKLLLFDTSNPEAPKFLSALELGPNAGPHDMDFTGDQQRLVVTDYFLNEDDFGVIHFDGDRQVHVVKVEPDKLTLDPRFQLDFNTAFPTGPARPHGIAMK